MNKMSTKDKGAIPKGIVAQETNRVPAQYKYVEYKCGFTNREGKQPCEWTTGLIGREEAYNLLGEHWEEKHDREHKDIEAEKEIERERKLNETLKALREKEHEDEMSRQQELYAIKMRNAAKLQRLQNGIFKEEDLSVGIRSEN